MSGSPLNEESLEYSPVVPIEVYPASDGVFVSDSTDSQNAQDTPELNVSLSDSATPHTIGPFRDASVLSNPSPTIRAPTEGNRSNHSFQL